MKISDPAAENNNEILDHIDRIGGGSVWEPEIFAVTLFDVAATDDQVAPLSGLVGVQQIVLNASNLSFSTIESIAHIPALESLVLCQHTLSDSQIDALRRLGPDVELVMAEA